MIKVLAPGCLALFDRSCFLSTTQCHYRNRVHKGHTRAGKSLAKGTSCCTAPHQKDFFVEHPNPSIRNTQNPTELVSRCTIELANRFVCTSVFKHSGNSHFVSSLQMDATVQARSSLFVYYVVQRNWFLWVYLQVQIFHLSYQM